jgi:hypothetical protein
MESEVYSMELTFKGKPRILTIRISGEAMEIMVSDLQGNQIEYIKQEGNNITIEKPK